MIKHVSFLYTKVKKGIKTATITTCVLYEMLGLVYEMQLFYWAQVENNK